MWFSGGVTSLISSISGTFPSSWRVTAASGRRLRCRPKYFPHSTQKRLANQESARIIVVSGAVRCSWPALHRYCPTGEGLFFCAGAGALSYQPQGASLFLPHEPWAGTVAQRWSALRLIPLLSCDKALIDPLAQQEQAVGHDGHTGYGRGRGRDHAGQSCGGQRNQQRVVDYGKTQVGADGAEDGARQ